MGFLLDRQQTVLVDGRKPPPHCVIFGVPQSSLLFLVFTGDIASKVVSSFLSNFTDDIWIGQ